MKLKPYRPAYIRLADVCRKYQIGLSIGVEMVKAQGITSQVRNGHVCVAAKQLTQLTEAFNHGKRERKKLNSLFQGRVREVYFIQSQDYVKIGIADFTPARIRMMQVGNPHPIRLLFTIPGEECEESELHRRFRAYHYRGEWFRLEGELAAFCDEERGKSRINPELERAMLAASPTLSTNTAA